LYKEGNSSKNIKNKPKMKQFIMITLVAMGIATMTSCEHKKEESTTTTDSTKTEMAAPDTTATVAPDTTAKTDSAATPAPATEEVKK